MSKEKSNKAAMTGESQNSKGTPQTPEGFFKVNPDRVDNYLRIVEGSEVMGELVGRFARTGKNAKDRNGNQQYYYQIRLHKSAPITRMEGEGEDREAVEVDGSLGDLVNVDERHALKGLAPLCGNGKHYLVIFTPKGKTAIGGGQSVWEFDGPFAKEMTEADSIPF